MVIRFLTTTLLLMTFIHGLVAQEAATQIPQYEGLLKEKKYSELIKVLSTSQERLGFLEEFYLGLAYFRIEDDVNAQLHLSSSINKNPTFFRSHDYLAGSLYFSGKLPEAEAEYIACLKLDSSYARGYYMLGQIYEKTSRANKAIENYILAARLVPTDESYNYRTGYMLYGQADFERSIPYFLETKKISPNNYSATSLLMESYFRSGKPDLGELLKPDLLRIRQNSTDKRLKELKSFQFDEYLNKGYRFVSTQIFEPTDGLYYFWSVLVYDSSGKQLKAINLESSAVIRELGVPYVVGVDEFDQGFRKHRTTDIGFKEIPKYEVMKEIVLKEIDQGLGESASGLYKEK